MITLDEINSTIERLKIVLNNSENENERFAASLLIQNLSNMLRQFSAIVETPEFKKEAEEWGKQNGIEK